VTIYIYMALRIPVGTKVFKFLRINSSIVVSFPRSKVFIYGVEAKIATIIMIADTSPVISEFDPTALFRVFKKFGPQTVKRWSRNKFNQ
jgi:hypothetical protein